MKGSFEGLDVETQILGTVVGGWVQIALSGEDEGIATNYLIKNMGLCPTSLDGVKKFSVLKGYIKNLGKSGEELSLDVGVFQPKSVRATVPLPRLQAQLVDGKKTALKKIAELWGLCENLPVSVKVVRVDKEEGSIEAELSDWQLKKYRFWQESLLDRLIVLGLSLYEVRMTMEHAQLDRDVIDVEPLGMFEHALTCKLGTDAAGLIPKIGRTLKNARFAVFNPKRLQEFLQVRKT